MEEPDSSKLDMPRRYTTPINTLYHCGGPYLPSAKNFPEFQFPSIVGRPILRSEEQGESDIVLKDIMCGDEAAAARSMLQISYPVCDGRPNEEDMENC